MTIEAVSALFVVASILGGFLAYILKSTIAPMKVVIENNTRAMDRVVSILDKHDEKLDDHEGRIVKIETVHELEAGR